MRAYSHGAVEVVETRTFVCGVGQDIEQCLLRNIGDVTVYIGGRNVDATGDRMGFPLEPGERQELKSFEYDSIEVWAVVTDDHTGHLAFLVSA